MATFNLATNVTATNAGVTNNGSYTIWTSSTVNNNNGESSIRLVMEYINAIPSYTRLTAFVESQQNGNWFPIAYQFSPFTDLESGAKRIILLQPDISTFNTGIDDDMYVGDQVIARISRQQGKLGTNFRVRLVLSENNYGTQNAFQSINFNCYGETFN